MVQNSDFMEANQMSLSVVVPAYNEEKMIGKAARAIGSVLQENHIVYEIVFVDDGSCDGTWKEIENLSKENDSIVGVRFSRNFGKESAIFAGMRNAKGDCCVVMDCDLQHPPETIIEMYHLWEQGYEIIEGVKRSRGKESVLHKASAGLFYKIISRAVQIDMSRASDFKLMDRKVVDEILELKEKNAFFRALSSWVGFEKAEVEFDVAEREEGESKWSTGSLIKYAITNIVAFSSAPMQFVTAAGIAFLVLAVALSVQTLVRYFMGHAVEGFTTVILLLLFIGSLLMISLGVIGYYISKIYEEVKGRPRYIVSKVTQK
jgi:dolichol-phosphate mannosyltransferase